MQDIGPLSRGSITKANLGSQALGAVQGTQGGSSEKTRPCRTLVSENELGEGWTEGGEAVMLPDMTASKVRS